MYSDRDGIASEQSQSAYNRRVRLLRLSTGVLLSVGLSTAVLEGEYTTLASTWRSNSRQGLHLCHSSSLLWPLFWFYSLYFYQNNDPISTYYSALGGTLMSSLLILSRLPFKPRDGHFTSLSLLQLFCCIFLLIVQISIPRRPQLFTAQGRVVDAEDSASLLGRLSLFWCHTALDIASKSADLDTMPVLNNDTRTASQLIITVPSSQPYLWTRIRDERLPRLVKQWTIVFLRAIFTLGSPYCMKRLLDCLQDPSRVTIEAWMWFVGMGASAVAEAVASSYIAWTQMSEIAIPVRSQLIISIFHKMLRKKDSKELGGKTSSKPASQTTCPSVINIVSADSHSLSFYTAIAYILPSRLFKFFFAALFLYRLLGWQSTVTAVVATFLCFSVHHSTIKRRIAARRKVRSSHDRTMTVVKEALSSLRDIKFSSLESQWESHIDTFREQELRDVSWTRTAATIQGIWDTAAPFVVIMTALSIFLYTGGQVSPSIIFPMISALHVLQDALSFIPTCLNDYFHSIDTARRIDKYLTSTEKQSIIEPSPSESIDFEDATIIWPSDDHRHGGPESQLETGSTKFSLQHLNMSFPLGELSIISGKTGSGKSLLLAGILGEVDLLQGHIKGPADECSSVAYVAQVPWLQSATIQENILFGSPLDQKRYDLVVSACALLPDFRVLADGDQTKVGLRGVRLSGGQRTRIGFARALYSSAVTLVLDNMFSSLDSHVSKEILSALTGEVCRGRTRILVTHPVSLCSPSAKYLVHLENNTVSYAGKPEAAANGMQNLGPNKLPSSALDPDASPSWEGSGNGNAAVATEASEAVQSNQPTTLASHPYKGYFAAAGGIWFTAVYCFCVIAGRLLNALASYLLSRIKSDGPAPGSSSETSAFPAIRPDIWYNLSLYLYTVAVLITATTLSKLHTDAATLRAARVLFRQMTFKSIAAFANGALNIISVIGIGFHTSKYTSIATILLLVWCRALMSRYNKASAMVKRTDRGPMADVLEHVTITDAGISTIRAFGVTDMFIDNMQGHIDTMSKLRRNSSIFYNWLSLQMSLSGIIFAMITGAFLLSSGSAHNVSRIGFTLTFAMQLSRTISLTSSESSNLESCMKNVASVIGFTELDMEDQSGQDVAAEWPTEGRIDVGGLQVGYAATLPPVLKAVNFDMKPGKTIGIVGRTGSGKSTLILALLRLLHAQKGYIYIDGVDISTLKVAMLRSKIGFIPQSPTLFEGTIRSNLDYFGKLSDGKIGEALRHVQLLPGEDEKSTSRFTADSYIAAGGENMSQGQRQLLCLARIILKDPKIIILDEATSAVDGETDVLIQEMIRKLFRGTLIVVAHRLETVVSFDRILVMSDGGIVEDGTPAELLSREGAFFNLVLRTRKFKQRRFKEDNVQSKLVAGGHT